MNDNYDLGAHLRACRHTSELTLADVARSLGVSVSYVSDVERERRVLSRERLEAFLVACRVPRKDARYVRAYQLLGRLPEHVEAKMLKKPEAW